jgi:hypothetical protein
MSYTEQRIRCNEFQRGIPESIEGWGTGKCIEESTSTIPLFTISIASPSSMTSGDLEELTDLSSFAIPSIVNIQSLGLFITLTEHDIEDPTKDYYIEDGGIEHIDKCRFFYDEALPTIEIKLYHTDNPGNIIDTIGITLERTDGVLGSSYHHIPVHIHLDPDTCLPTYNRAYIRITPVSGFSIKVDYARLYIGYTRVIRGNIKYNMHTGMIEGDGTLDLFAYSFVPASEELYFGYFNDIIPYTYSSTIYVDDGDVPTWFPDVTDVDSYFYARKYIYTGAIQYVKVIYKYSPNNGYYWSILSESLPFPNGVNRIYYPIKSYYDAATISVNVYRYLKTYGNRMSYPVSSDSLKHGLNNCEHRFSDIMFEYMRFRIVISSDDRTDRDQYLLSINPVIYSGYNDGDGTSSEPGGLVAADSGCYLFDLDTDYPFDLYGSICTLILPPEYQTYSYLVINAYAYYEFTNVNYVSFGRIKITGSKTIGDSVYVQYEDGPGYDNYDIQALLQHSVMEALGRQTVSITVRVRVYATDTLIYEDILTGNYDGNYAYMEPKWINFIRSSDIRVEFNLIDFCRDAYIHTIEETYFGEHYPGGDESSIIEYTSLDIVNIQEFCLRYGRYPGTGKIVRINEFNAFVRGGIFHIRTPHEFEIYIESARAVSKVYIVVVSDGFVFNPEEPLTGIVIATSTFSNIDNIDNQYPYKTISARIPAYKFSGIKRIAAVFENDAGRGIMYATDGIGNPLRVFVHDPPINEVISLYASYGGASIVPISDPLIVGQTIYVVKEDQIYIHMLRIQSVDTFDPECRTYPYFNNSNHYDRVIMPSSNLETFYIDTPGTFSIECIVDGTDDSYHPINGSIVVLPPTPAIPNIVEYPRLLATFASAAEFEASDLYETRGAEFDYIMVNGSVYVWGTDSWIPGTIPDDDPLNEGKKTVVLDLESVYADVSSDCPCIKYTLEYTIRFIHLPRLIGEFSTWEDLMAVYPEGGYDKDYAKVGDPAVNHIWGEVEGVMMWHPGTIPAEEEISEDTIEIPEYGADHGSWISQYENSNLENHYFRLEIEGPGLYRVEYEGVGSDVDNVSEISFEFNTSIDT